MTTVSRGTSHVTTKQRCNHFGGYSKTRSGELVTYSDSHMTSCLTLTYSLTFRVEPWFFSFFFFFFSSSFFSFLQCVLPIPIDQFQAKALKLKAKALKRHVKCWLRVLHTTQSMAKHIYLSWQNTIQIFCHNTWRSFFLSLTFYVFGSCSGVFLILFWYQSFLFQNRFHINKRPI